MTPLTSSLQRPELRGGIDGPARVLLVTTQPVLAELIALTLNHGRVAAQVRAALDEPTLVGLWAEGKALSLEQAAAYALETATLP